MRDFLLQNGPILAWAITAFHALILVLALRAFRKTREPLYLLLAFLGFGLCFVVYMAMGYLGSRDSNTAAANWLEQGVNTLGQVLLLWGVLGLHRAGLRDYRL